MKRMMIVAVFACLLEQARASVLFENSVLFNYQASGPVSLMGGQNASVCATNLDNSPVAILIALFQADNGSLLGFRQDVLQPGGGSCLNYLKTPQPNPLTQGGNVVGLVAANAHLEQGTIVQVGPGGGGCIAASLQIQGTTIYNAPSQTFLYVPMKDFQEMAAPGNIH